MATWRRPAALQARLSLCRVWEKEHTKGGRHGHWFSDQACEHGAPNFFEAKIESPKALEPARAAHTPSCFDPHAKHPRHGVHVRTCTSACLAFQHTQQGMRVEPPGDVRALGILDAPGHL